VVEILPRVHKILGSILSTENKRKLLAGCGLGYIVRPHFKKPDEARGGWLTPIILPTLEAEIRRAVVQSQPGKIA
jgi:hypothetical protein